MGTQKLEAFLLDVLPPLEYLELSSLALPEDLIHKVTQKFKQFVIFGSPELPSNRKQFLLTYYNISVSVLFAKDFPVDLAPPEHSENGSKPETRNTTDNTIDRILATSSSAAAESSTNASPLKRPTNSINGNKFQDTRI